jgi:hypothetical protein
VKSQNYTAPGKGEWETPADLMATLVRDFGRFDLDPCATVVNCKASWYYGPDHPRADRRDGLARDWRFGPDNDGNADSVVYCNPPYGRDVGRWVEKCYQEVQLGNAGMVVALLPVSPDTRWWQTWVPQATEVRFLKGRVRFVGAAGPAPFASAIVVWRRGMIGWHYVSYWDWKRYIPSGKTAQAVGSI